MSRTEGKGQVSRTEELYNFIHDYAVEKDLKYTLMAIPAAQEVLKGKIRKGHEFDMEGVLQQSFYEHALQTTKMLIDLKIPLSPEEEDILVAGAVCHDTILHGDFPRDGLELMEDYHLDPRIYEIVRVTSKINIRTEADLREFYDGISKNKLAVLLAMADRGNLVENLYALSVSEALGYISEIRKYSLPMCVYALEHYPDIHMAMEIIMGKIHNLIDVTDIISRRYQDREIAYDKEILAMVEENSKLRGMIRQLEET